MATDLNAIRNELNRLNSKGSSQNFLDNFVPMPAGEGSIIIRLLPPLGNNPLPFMSTRTHKLKEKNVHCLRSLINDKWVGNCPACVEYSNLWQQSERGHSKEAEEDLKNASRALKPNERYYWNCIVRKVVTKTNEVLLNVGPKIFSCGKKMQQKLLRAIEGDASLNLPGYGDITDLMTGRDLCVVKRIIKGSGNFTYPDYGESTFVAPNVAGSQEEIAKWMGALHDLNSLRRLLPVHEVERLIRVHQGLEEDTDEGYSNHSFDNSEEETPVPATKRTISVPPVQKVPVKNDDQDEAQFEEDFLARLKNM